MSQKCKLCDATTRKITHQKIGDFYRCSQCEFIFKDAKDFLNEDEELTIYNQHNNSINDPRYVNFFYEFLEDAVFPFVHDVTQALDFGSGPAPVLAELLEQNHNYDIDIYDKFYASEKVYQGKKYDLITSTEVVEHLSDPIKYFKLFAQLLKPNGILAIMTLFHHNDDAHFLKWHYIGDQTHISFYTPKTMEYIASKTGLKVIHSNNVRYTTFVLNK